MNPVQTLPRFLLPRLSWTTPLSTIPRASAVVFQQARDTAKRTGWQDSPRRSVHATGAGSVKRRGGGALAENSSNIPSRAPSSIVRNPALRRAFHASAARRRDHHFDTLRFVQRLQEEGFTEEQSVAMMKVLNDVIEERSVSVQIIPFRSRFPRI